MGTSTILVQDISDEEAELSQENRAEHSSTSATESRGQATQVTRTPSTSYERIGYRDASTSPGRPGAVQTSVTAASQTDEQLIGSVDAPRSADNGQAVSLPLRRIHSIHSPASEQACFMRLPSGPPPPYPGVRRTSPPHRNRTTVSNGLSYLNQNLLHYSTNDEEQIRAAVYQSMRDLVRARR